MAYVDHYGYLEEVLPKFLSNLGSAPIANELIVAHSEKCLTYMDSWRASGISAYEACAIYMLTFVHPYCKEVRDTPSGWESPTAWVVNNHHKFSIYLPKETPSNPDPLEFGRLTKTQVKAIFIRNGFSVKEDTLDLDDRYYRVASALLKASENKEIISGLYSSISGLKTPNF